MRVRIFGLAVFLMGSAAVLPTPHFLSAAAQPAAGGAATEARNIAFFQSTEQSLMDAIAVGDREPWQRVMDDSCVITTEEGEVLTKKDFLKQLTPLPTGLSGSIQVTDLTVQEFADFTIARFRLNETETVFGQQLATKYRVTDTFRQQGQEWKMVASHTSVVTSDPQAQRVSTADWGSLVGRYQLIPNGWIFNVSLRQDGLYGGREGKAAKRMIPLAPNVFVLTGSLGEWIFVTDKRGPASRIVEFRKFEPLVWTRIGS